MEYLEGIAVSAPWMKERTKRKSRGVRRGMPAGVKGILARFECWGQGANVWVRAADIGEAQVELIDGNDYYSSSKTQRVLGIWHSFALLKNFLQPWLVRRLLFWIIRLGWWILGGRELGDWIWRWSKHTCQGQGSGSTDGVINVIMAPFTEMGST